MSEGTTEELARFAAEVRFEDLPARVVRLAKRQIVGLLGAAFAGARTGGVQAIARALGRAAAPTNGASDLASARSTALALRGRTGIEDAAYLNACCSIAHDMDDYVVFGHTGHSAVFAALAAGEALGRSGRDVLLAQVIGNELGGRLGGACVLGPQNGQLWSYIHQLAGAAATGRLLGLDARTMRHALGIALAQPSFGLWPAFMGPDSKLATAAEPLRTGVRAAYLAHAGLTGPREILDGPKGLLGRIPFVPIPGFLTGLGRAWLTETLSVKLAPGCAYVTAPVHAAGEALRLLARENRRPVEPDEIESVTVRAGLLTVAMDELSRPYVAQVAVGGAQAPLLSPVVVNFSTPLSVALTVLDEGELAPAGLEEERLARDQDAILRLARRVQVEHDPPRTAALLRECDRVLDLAELLSGVPLADLAQGARAQASLHVGGGAVAALVQALDTVRNLGPQGRSFARRLLERRAGDAVHRVREHFVRALEDAVPHGDQTRPRPAPAPARDYDLGRRPLSGFRALFGATVEVRTRAGQAAQASCEVPPGAAGSDDDATDRDVAQKLHRHGDPWIGPAAVERLLGVVARLEQEPDLSNLAGALESVAVRS